MVPQKFKILQNYPFAKLDPPIILVEGCKEYDGVIGDPPGVMHKGIDYVRKKKDEYLPFEVFAAHDGEAFWSISERGWGIFASVRLVIGDYRLETFYVHLDKVNEKLVRLPEDKKVTVKFIPVKAGEWLGTAGVTGNTNNIIQLHFEMHRKNLKTGEREILDPYGVYDRASSGKYPQPGESLKGLSHTFSSENPGFAKG
jgi:murein DD-endopeptidase MepM/ murein hydrolase activator NlpD